MAQIPARAAEPHTINRSCSVDMWIHTISEAACNEQAVQLARVRKAHDRTKESATGLTRRSVHTRQKICTRSTRACHSWCRCQWHASVVRTRWRVAQSIHAVPMAHAEQRSRHDFSGTQVPDATPKRSAYPIAMRLQKRQCVIASARKHDTSAPPLVFALWACTDKTRKTSYN